jgi:hypothetical protein
MSKSEEKMNFAMQKISHLLNTTNKSQIRLFLSLLCTAIVLFMLVVFL